MRARVLAGGEGSRLRRLTRTRTTQPVFGRNRDVRREGGGAQRLVLGDRPRVGVG